LLSLVHLSRNSTSTREQIATDTDDIMKIVGLVSGGKDSILSLMIAQVMGHEPIVLANLYAADAPAPSSSSSSSSLVATEGGGIPVNAEELDSFMFQTVGHSLIPSIADCCDIPLRRKIIAHGQSREQALDYTLAPDPDDEVEILFHLLESIKEEFPDVRGVVSGAILSHYQRLRVEAVCHRLGLTSIAPMWQLKAEEVLSLVAAAGVDARLIKVATFGLTPAKHLGRSLLEAPLRNELLHLQKTVQLHAAGEGGEFESLVVDCPLFSTKKIQILETRTYVDAEQPDVAALAITKHVVVDKTSEEKAKDAQQLLAFTTSEVLVAALKMRWTPSLLTLGSTPHGIDAASAIVTPERLFASDHVVQSADDAAPVVVVRRFIGGDLQQSELSPQMPGNDVVLAGASATFTSIHQWLHQSNREALFLLIVCPSMSLFLPVNKVYETFFEIVRPPGRAFVEDATVSSLCVEVWSIPRRQLIDAGLHVRQERKCLHVQSISPWAAASIGPYAQANRIWYRGPATTSKCHTTVVQRDTDHIIVSGRIGMVPLTQNVATFADLQATATAEAPHVLPAPPQLPSGVVIPDAVWGSFVAEFMFMMANSVVGLEHFCGSPLQWVTHATFFVPMKLFASGLGQSDAHILVEAAWEMYWNGISASSYRFPHISWVSSNLFLDELNNTVPAEEGCTRARLLLTTGLPKGALVEVILEKRMVESVDDDDEE
jgi:diphthine-ammonia ligase